MKSEVQKDAIKTAEDSEGLCNSQESIRIFYNGDDNLSDHN
jgi:hypothetical protein